MTLTVLACIIATSYLSGAALPRRQEKGPGWFSLRLPAGPTPISRRFHDVESTFRRQESLPPARSSAASTPAANRLRVV